MESGFPQQWVLPRKQWAEGPQGNPTASTKHLLCWDKEALESSISWLKPQEYSTAWFNWRVSSYVQQLFDLSWSFS